METVNMDMGEPSNWFCVRFKSWEDKTLFMQENPNLDKSSEGNPVTAWLRCTELLLKESEYVEDYVFSSDQRHGVHDDGDFADDMLKRGK